MRELEKRNGRRLSGRGRGSGRPLAPFGVVYLALLGLGTVGALAVYLLLVAFVPGASGTRLDAMKTALLVVAGSGAGAGLYVQYRKQQTDEAKSALDHANSRRDQDKLFTERYTAAVAQLGNPAAAVRLGGVYALARIADDSARDRPTCLEVLCAYLRMPYDSDDPAIEKGEREVRTTAQAAIGARLRLEHPGFWLDARIDLSGAHLIGLRFHRITALTFDAVGATFDGGTGFGGATFRQGAGFGGATFRGGAVFSQSTFRGLTGFGGATFDGDAAFIGTTFDEHVRFSEATFNGQAVFNEAVFRKEAGFGEATFNGQAVFNKAIFPKEAGFGKARFNGTAMFDGATFNGHAGFDGAAFSEDARFGGATFSEDAGFEEATFTKDALFGGVTFGGTTCFSKAKFSESAGFSRARFSWGAMFEGAAFGRNAWFDMAAFGRNADFDMALFSGDAWFRGATFGGRADFDMARFGGRAEFVGARFRRDYPIGWPPGFAEPAGIVRVDPPAPDPDPPAPPADLPDPSADSTDPL